MEVNNSKSTASTNADQQLVYEFPNLIRVFADGRVERLKGTDFVPPSLHPYPQVDVSSKDITLDSQNDVSVRLFLPPQQHSSSGNNHKLPLLVYFHGGAFCTSSPFNAAYHNHLIALVSEANVVAVSVNYRLAPEHPIPAAYQDSWVALQWVASHRNGYGPEPWLNECADFQRVFLAGNSAGGNIVHNLVMMVGDPDLGLGMDVLGACLVQPFFWGSTPIGSEELNPNKKALVDGLWPFLSPSMPDNDDPRINPVAKGAPSLAWLGCRRVLVCVAEKDVLRDREWLYYDSLSRGGWIGVAEIEETKGEGHGFHLNDPECNKAKDLIKCMAEFFQRDMPPLI